MSHRPIIDAGPGLNFFAINQERLLIGVLGCLSAPESVQKEVLRKSKSDERFKAAEHVWRKLLPKWMEILPDDHSPELAAVVNRVSRQPMEQRLKKSQDLGELMVVAHAVVAAEAGAAVTVLIDDGEGARTAQHEIHRLDRLRATNPAIGTIQLANTLTVLERAAHLDHIADKGAMREIYSRLRKLDDGLPPIEDTKLLSPPLWPRFKGG